MARSPFKTSGKGGTGWARKSATGVAKPARISRVEAVPFCPVRAVVGLTGLPQGLRVVLPWPPIQLNPNHRLHGAKKARFVREYRKACWELALEAFGVGSPRFSGATPLAVRLDFFPPNARKRDDDNAEAAFKAGRDGVAQALRIDDARFIVTRALHSEPRGCVVMTFTDIHGDPA